MTKSKAQRRKQVVLPENKKSKPKAAKTPSSLMDKADDEELDQRRPKRQRVRCLDAAVSKAIADNCKGMTVQETDLTLIDGKSMRDRILDAKKAQKAGEPITIGKSFYSRLREEYGSASGLGRSMTNPRRGRAG